MTPSPPSPPFTPAPRCRRRAPRAKVCYKNRKCFSPASLCPKKVTLEEKAKIKKQSIRGEVSLWFMSHFFLPCKLLQNNSFISLLELPLNFHPLFSSWMKMPLSLAFHPLFSVGGVAKSQNSSQMNLSGSSSSLTSDASTKAGTISLRSYGIGGALLHKRILLMTRQHSRERSRERENQMVEEGQEKEERMQEETEAVERRGRSRQQNNLGAQGESGLMLQRVRTGRTGSHGVNPTGSPPSVPGLGPMGLSPLSQPQLMSPKPQESPIRTRLMSPFRILRERSQSRERPMAVKAHLNSGEGTTEVELSSPQDERQGQAEQRARRSVSPNPFLWLCRDRHTRRKTVWHREREPSHPFICWVKTANWRKNELLMIDYVWIAC